jgi:hypothetical protein
MQGLPAARLFLQAASLIHARLDLYLHLDIDLHHFHRHHHTLFLLLENKANGRVMFTVTTRSFDE